MSREINKLGWIELRHNRIYLIHRNKNIKTEIDITPVWHFFKEVNDFIKQPNHPTGE